MQRWVQIVDPRTEQPMFANLDTGECSWEPPPPGVDWKQIEQDCWWQLYDSKTSRYYYYNFALRQTRWQRPDNVDFLSMTVLQGLTDLKPELDMKSVLNRKRSDKRDVSTQTPSVDKTSLRRYYVGRHHKKPAATPASAPSSLSVPTSSLVDSPPAACQSAVLMATDPDVVLVTSTVESERDEPNLTKPKSGEIPVPEPMSSVSLVTPEKPVTKMTSSESESSVERENSQSERRAFPRTNPTCSPRKPTVDAPVQPGLSLNPTPSSAGKTATIHYNTRAISIPLASSARRMSHDTLLGAELNMTSRSHARRGSEPHNFASAHPNIVSIRPAPEPPVSRGGVDSRSSNVVSLIPITPPSDSEISQKQQMRSKSPASSPPSKRPLTQPSPCTESSPSAPSSPVSPDDELIDPTIYRRKKQGARSLPQQPNRRRSLKIGSDIIDASTGLNKRGSAPVFGTFGQLSYEQYVAENMYERRRGFFRQNASIDNMLSWTKDSINKPMLRTTNKSVKKEAIEIFKSIQVYMGDRLARVSPTQAALDIASKGWSNVELRDEIYVQLCRQTTQNNQTDSLRRGWELIGICLSFFPPSARFHIFLEGYISKHFMCDSVTEQSVLSRLAGICHRRLQLIAKNGPKRGLKQPSMDEIDHSLHLIYHPSMFGATLEEVMELQTDRFPRRQLPWILTTLSDEVIRLNGHRTEGIFRVPGDLDEVNELKTRCDQWQNPAELCVDPHTPASLLKLWYRELAEPLIPEYLYTTAVNHCADVPVCLDMVYQLPEINRLVLLYLVKFLQIFAKPENVLVTKMDVNNISMVWAPNCLRCNSDNPVVVLENARKEMGFLRILIQNLDTTGIEEQTA